MARGNHEPLTRAATDRKFNRSPSPADLQVCRSNRWKGADVDPVDMDCWNGKRPDRPACTYVGSQNLPVYAETGLGRWQFHVALARLWEREGMFGMEIGSPGDFYCRGVLGCLATAHQHLLASVRTAEQAGGAESIRRAIRSAAAWDAITALPVLRAEDEVHYSDQIVRAHNRDLGKSIRLCVAVSGMRWSEKAQTRGEMTSEDSHSEFLYDAMRGGKDFAGILTSQEQILLRSTVYGHMPSAKIVAGWMFGTIETPNKTWRFRLRRTTLGTESVFLGSYPNSMKPMRTVTQLLTSGKWIGMRPSPETFGRKQGGWAEGFQVAINDGVIEASCRAGQASLPELGGEIVWQVDVEGGRVTFQG